MENSIFNFFYLNTSLTNMEFTKFGINPPPIDPRKKFAHPQFFVLLRIFPIKVFAISEHFSFFLAIWVHFSFSFTIKSAHTNFHDPRLIRSPRKVRAEKKESKKEREITLLIEATTFATQPICNDARPAHALRSYLKGGSMINTSLP
jgi:hypothetical protein